METKTALTIPETPKVDPDAIWKVYAATLETDNLDVVCRFVGISAEEHAALIAAPGPFRNAYEAAKSKRGLGILAEYVDRETVETWELLRSVEDAEPRQRALMELGNKGDLARQRLFVHAVVETNFNIPTVCKKLGISKRTLDQWTRDSKEFRDMLDNIDWAKRSFVESSLMRLIAAGDSKATIAAAQALLRDEYGPTVRVEGQINHAVAVVDLGAIKLPVEVRRAILDSVKDAGLTDLDGLFVAESVGG